MRSLLGGDAGDGGFEDFAGEDEVWSCAGAAAVEGGGLAEDDDVFDLGWVDGGLEHAGAELLFGHVLQTKALMLGLFQVEDGDLGEHFAGVFGNFAVAAVGDLGAGEGELDAEEVVEVAVGFEGDSGGDDEHVVSLGGGLDEGVEFGEHVGVALFVGEVDAWEQ